MYESSSTHSKPTSLMLSPDPGALKAWPWLPVDEAIKSSPQFHTEPVDIQIASSKGHWRGYFLVSFKNQSSVAFSLNLSRCIFKHR